MQNAELFAEIVKLAASDEFTSIGMTVRVRPHNAQGFYPLDPFIPCGEIAEFQFTLDFETAGKRRIISHRIDTKDDFAVAAFAHLLHCTATLSFNEGKRETADAWRNSIYEDHHS